MDGINTELADVTSYVISGKTYTKADLLAVLTGRIDAGKRTLAARTAMHVAVADEQSLLPTALALREGVKLFLAMRFGKEESHAAEVRLRAAQDGNPDRRRDHRERREEEQGNARRTRNRGQEGEVAGQGAPTAAPPPTTAALGAHGIAARTGGACRDEGVATPTGATA